MCVRMTVKDPTFCFDVASVGFALNECYEYGHFEWQIVLTEIQELWMLQLAIEDQPIW